MVYDGSGSINSQRVKEGKSKLPPTVEQAVEDPDDDDSLGYLYRPGELMVDTELVDVKEVKEQLSSPAVRAKRIDETPIGKTGVVHLQLAQAFRKDRFFDAAAKVMELPGVTFNHVMVPGYHPEPEPASWPGPVGALPFDFKPQLGSRGAGATVAIFDSGIVESFDLPGRAAPDHIERPPSRGRLPRFAGHGTFIAGLVRLNAPSARIHAHKIFDGRGYIDDAVLAHCLGNLGNDVDVLNLSFGGPTESGRQLTASQKALHALLERSPNLVVVASAGNDGVDLPWWPGADPDERVLSVGALTADGAKRACFSNHGTWIDVCTEGEGLKSAFFQFRGRLGPTGPTRPHPCFPDQTDAHFSRTFTFKGGATWSGTSFAAAKISGHIAATMEPGKAPDAAAALVAGRLFNEPSGFAVGVRVETLR